jgi:hypothetical protein
MTTQGNEGSVSQTETPVETSVTNISKDDVVPRDSFRQILDEKKKVQQENHAMKARLDQLEAEQKQREEQALIDQQNWKKLAEKHSEEAKAAKELLEGQMRRQEEERKRSMFSSELKLKDEKYWKLVDLDDVPNDPESIKLFAQEFKKNHPDIVVQSSITPPPGTSPMSNSRAPVQAPKTIAEAEQAVRDFWRQHGLKGSSHSKVE